MQTLRQDIAVATVASSSVTALRRSQWSRSRLGLTPQPRFSVWSMRCSCVLCPSTGSRD